MSLIMPGFDKYVVRHSIPGIVNADDEEQGGGCNAKQRLARFRRLRNLRKRISLTHYHRLHRLSSVDDRVIGA
jgi:hypothetical protein